MNEGTKLEPDTLAVSIGGYSRPSWKVAWQKSHLLYTVFAAEYETQTEEKIVPTPDDWRRFWERLDACGTWGWDAYYFASAPESTTWTLEILLKDGRYIDTGGTSSFPGIAEARARRGPRGGVEAGGADAGSFALFLDAVRELIGGRAFFPFDPESLQGEISREEAERLAPAPAEPARGERSGRRGREDRGESDPEREGAPRRAGRGSRERRRGRGGRETPGAPGEGRGAAQGGGDAARPERGEARARAEGERSGGDAPRGRRRGRRRERLPERTGESRGAGAGEGAGASEGAGAGKSDGPEGARGGRRRRRGGRGGDGGRAGDGGRSGDGGRGADGAQGGGRSGDEGAPPRAGDAGRSPPADGDPSGPRRRRRGRRGGRRTHGRGPEGTPPPSEG